MKITKYEHACLVVEEKGKRLVIDPGVFSLSLLNERYDVVVVTHVHSDHMDTDKLKALISINPDLEIMAVSEAAKELSSRNITTSSVSGGQTLQSAGFQLEFFGREHAIIHPDWPRFENVGVLVNGKLYHPGDSFTLPGKTVEILAVPASGPWMKVQEAMDFIMAIKPKLCFPTHNALLSEVGESIEYNWLEQACQKVGAKFTKLDPSQSIEV